MSDNPRFLERIANCALLIPAQVLFAVAVIISLGNLFALTSQTALFLLAAVMVIVLPLIEGINRVAFFILFSITLLFFGIWLYRTKMDNIQSFSMIIVVVSVGLVQVFRNSRIGFGVVTFALTIFTAVPFFFGKDNTIAILLGVISVLWMLPLFSHEQKKGHISVRFASKGGLLLGMTGCIVIIIGVAATATAIMPDYPVGNSLNLIIENANVIEHLTQAYKDYDLEHTGFKFGGPVYPDKNTVFRVSSETRQLLRSKVYTNYTGYDWSIPGSITMYLDSGLYESIKTEVFDLERPESENLPEEFFINYEMKITPSRYNYAIPTPYRYDTISFGKLVNPIIIFNEFGDVFTYNKYSDAYIIKGSVPDTEGQEFIDWMTVYADKFSESYEKKNLLEETYCQLPSVRSEQLASISEMVAGEGNSYVKARNIQKWLYTNFSYSKIVPYPTGEKDFVEEFIETGRGYCVYFATAMTVLLRYQGIPARYVTGYGMPEKKSGGIYDITNEYGHAWCEVYFEGIGWIPFDPTAPESIETDTTSDSLAANTPNEQEPSTPAINHNPAMVIAETIENSSTMGEIVLLVIAFLLVLSVFLVLLHRYRFRTSFQSSTLADWYAIERALAFMGSKRPKSEPISLFAERRAPFFSHPQLMIEAAKEAEHLLFHPTGESNGKLVEVRRMLTAKLKEKSKLKWLLFVVLY